jgi:peptidoglycan/xylan/chitin deacetylase (PgdA/CDA1 family)
VPKTIYLTFDDGPDPTITTSMVHILAAKQVEATFFLTGADPSDKNDSSSPDAWLRIYCDDQTTFRSNTSKNAVRSIRGSGHAIGIHGWRHDHPWNQQPDGGVSEVSQTESALKDILGEYGLYEKLLRAPGGDWPTVPIPGYEDWYYYEWNIKAQDHTGPTGDVVVKNVMDDLAAKNYPDEAIVLMHSIFQGTLDAINDSNYDLVGKLQQQGGYTIFKKLPRDQDSPGKVIRPNPYP